MTRARIFTISIILLLSVTQSIIADMYDDSKVIAISGGENHTLVVTANNWPWGAGHNGFWELGIGNDANNQRLLRRVRGPNDVNFLRNITAVAAGWYHSLALDANGTIWSFGTNDQGQLGDYSNEPRKTPVQVHGPNNLGLLDGIVAISAGRSGKHSLAIDVNGHALAWGLNSSAELGDGSTTNKLTPVYVHAGEQNPANPNSPLADIIAISGGAHHTMVLDANGNVWTAGSDSAGQRGNGAESGANRPVQVHAGEQNPANPNGPLQNIVAVAAGWDHCLALERLDPCDANCQGRIYAWGANGHVYYYGGGQLGDGTMDDKSAPVVVHAGQQDPCDPNGPMTGIVAISAGEGHSMALDVNGQVLCWGEDHGGQLGNDSNRVRSLTPVRVLRYDGPPLSDINTVSAGYWHNLAIDGNGTLWVWGTGGQGSPALGDLVDKPVAYPRAVVYNLTQGTFAFGIKPAVNDACNLDVLEAWPGTYFETGIDFGNKTITVRSVNPDDRGVVERTVIEGHGSSYNVKFSGGDPTLAGFAIIKSWQGILSEGGAPLIVNCLLRQHRLNAIYATGGTPYVIACTIEGTTEGGGIAATGDVPQMYISDSIINANASCGICRTGGSTTVSDCLIHNNQGTGISATGGNLSVERCRVADNAADGIYLSVYSGSPTIKIIDNWIYHNSGDGFHMACYYSPPYIRNNTVAFNSGYGATCEEGSSATITNCIIWGNASGQLSNCTATYSCMNVSPISGPNNINTDPCFVAAEANNFHLKPESLCIDVGKPDSNEQGELDIDGEPRVLDGDSNGTSIVDIGADEFYWPKADYDDSGIANFIDYAYFASHWQTTDANISLDADSDVDINDLELFCDVWLWTAPWMEEYQQMMCMGGESGMMMPIPEEMLMTDALESAPVQMDAMTIIEPPPTIEEMIDWLDEVWKSGQLDIPEDEYLAFRKLLEEQLQ